MGVVQENVMIAVVGLTLMFGVYGTLTVIGIVLVYGLYQLAKTVLKGDE